MANNEQIRRVKLSDLIPDSHNANLHTERGTYMVSRSLEKLGAGRSILIDKDNEIIAGNLTAEQAADMGLEEVIIVPTDGKTLVAVQRVDMDLDDPATGAREMAYADNRAAVISIDFDPDVIGEDLEIGIDLGDWWHDWELSGLVGDLPDEDKWGAAFSKIPDEDRAPFQQMTFTLHDSQVERVKAAIRAAKNAGSFDAPNENSNGNALARICEMYLSNGQG